MITAVIIIKTAIGILRITTVIITTVAIITTTHCNRTVGDSGLRMRFPNEESPSRQVFGGHHCPNLKYCRGPEELQIFWSHILYMYICIYVKTER